ncbi:MAG: Flp pilus assembly protein CpaB [Thermodesulfobacteriota bacterium]|nr:Flp pilus assembly protein CpaB [Thermodesulfobacteriota bacterium]
MERWRVFVPIALAVIVAVVGSVLLYKWMKKQTAPKRVAKVESLQVAVAEVEIPAGTKLKPEMMKTAYFIKESLPQGYFSTPEKAAGRIVVTPINRTELILESRLAPKDVKRGGMAAILKPGKRAVSVAGNKVLGLSGLINPGDRVDILLTTADPKKPDVKVNKTVFENVLVLATGTQLRRNAEGKPSPVDNYTLEVTPEQGEKLVLAASQGKIHFALRSVLDKETVLTTGATHSEILASYRPVESTKRAKSKLAIKEGGTHTRVRRGTSAGKGFTLEVIKGLNRSVQNF